MKDKLFRHEGILHLHNLVRGKGLTCKLVGGAVVDIIDGKTPKDYDLIVGQYGQKSMMEILREDGFKFYGDSSTALTFIKGKIIVQILKTKVEDFDFTVSQSSIDLVEMYCDLAEYAIENKILVPTSYTDKTRIFSSLARIPHWMKKGYKMPEITYYSLLNALSELTDEPKDLRTKQVTYPFGS